MEIVERVVESFFTLARPNQFVAMQQLEHRSFELSALKAVGRMGGEPNWAGFSEGFYQVDLDGRSLWWREAAEPEVWNGPVGFDWILTTPFESRSGRLWIRYDFVEVERWPRSAPR